MAPPRNISCYATVITSNKQPKVINRAANLNSIILPNSKKYFFWTQTRTWTRIKLFEFIKKICKLLKRNKRSPRNIVCCWSSHNPCKLKLWFYQKKSCISFICSCQCDLQPPGLQTRSFMPNSKNKILWTRTCNYLLNSNSNLNSDKNRSSSHPW